MIGLGTWVRQLDSVVLVSFILHCVWEGGEVEGMEGKTG